VSEQPLARPQLPGCLQSQRSHQSPVRATALFLRSRRYRAHRQAQ
jgi:hypothetical protein